MNAPLDPSDIVDEWLLLAREDLATAADMVPKQRWRHVCFHAQQAAQKTEGRVTQALRVKG
jgi:hypothetical protein